jgi:putative component of membrane protein insertase Oxa1/YidC/SpoIIIJ protein YidD
MPTPRLLPISTLLLTVLACRSAPSPRCETVPAFGPWDARDALPAPGTDDGSGARDLPDALIAFYQRHMRAPHLPGTGCRLRPTCSVFARQAFQKWYLFGFVLVADRLFVREHPLMDAAYLPACALRPTDDQGLDDPVP